MSTLTTRVLIAYAMFVLLAICLGKYYALI